MMRIRSGAGRSTRRRASTLAVALAGSLAVLAPLAAGAQDPEANPSDRMMTEGEENMQLSGADDPMRQARNLFFSGKRHVKSAAKLDDKAEKATGEERDELLARARKEREAAAESFTQAIQTGPAYLDAYVELGAVLRDLGRGEDALKVHAAALGRDGGHDENFRGYVLSLLALDRLGNAAALYDQVKAESPKRARIVYEALAGYHAEHASNPGGLAAEDLARLEAWLAERKSG